MKRFSVLVLVLLLTTASVFADTTYVIVGSAFRQNAIPFWGLNYDALRFQTLYLQNEINRSGRIVAFGLSSTGDQPSNFYNVKVMLCHTSLDELTSEFIDNYAGNIPVIILEAETLLVGTGQNLTWYFFPASFDYNNTDNLLLEITWNGDDGRTVTFWRNTNGNAGRRLFAYSDTAKSGRVDSVNAYYASIGFVESGINEVSEFTPANFTVIPRIGQGPFRIKFFGQYSRDIEIAMMDVSGRMVECLNPIYSADGYHAIWYTQNKSEGIYFCRISQKGKVETYTLTVMR